ncbi:hypothetical protein ACIPUD_39070 [Bradyrhizobium sp. CAR08]
MADKSEMMHAIWRQMAGVAASKYKFAALACSFALLLAAVLWLVEPLSVPVLIRLQTSRVLFKTGPSAVDRELSLPAQLHVKRIDNFASVESSNTKLASSSSSALRTVTASNPGLSLSRIKLFAGQTIGLTAFVRGDLLISATTDAGTAMELRTLLPQGAFLLGGQNYLRTNESDKITNVDPMPDAVIFQGRQSTIPLTIYASPAAAPTNCGWENKPEYLEPSIEDLPISAISFGSEPASLEPTIRTSLLTGTIEFPDTERKIMLSSGELLKASFRKATISALRILPCYLLIELSADASRVSISTSETNINLMPSLLEVLFKQRSIALIGSGLAAFWGFLWGARKLFLKTGEAE